MDLTAREMALLEFLLRHKGQVMSKREILEHVWDYDFEGDASAVETYVSYLRRKLDDRAPRLIHTVRGFGYSLRAPEAEISRPVDSV